MLDLSCPFDFTKYFNFTGIMLKNRDIASRAIKSKRTSYNIPSSEQVCLLAVNKHTEEQKVESKARS